MKCIVAIASVLSCIAAVCIASPTATAQYHLRAPERGCVEISHSVGVSVFRAYACDGADGELHEYSLVPRPLRSQLFNVAR